MEHWAAARAELPDEECASLWHAELSTLVAAGGDRISVGGLGSLTSATAVVGALARVPPRGDSVRGRLEPLCEGEDADFAADTANLGPIVPLAASVGDVVTINVPPSVVDMLARPQAAIVRTHPLLPYTMRLRLAPLPPNDRDQLHAQRRRVVEYFLGMRAKGERPHVMTDASLAEVLDVNKKLIKPWTLRAAAAAIFEDRALRLSLEYELSSDARFEPLVYVDFDWSDETPMHIGLDARVDTVKFRAHHGDAMRRGGSCESLIERSVAFATRALPVSRSAAPCKILNSGSYYGMVVRNKNTGDLVSIVGESLTTLQHLDRCTVEVLFEAGQQRSAVSEYSDRFSRRIRMGTLDRHATNDRCERHLMRARASWSRIGLACEIHMTFVAQSKTFNGPMRDAIQGVLRFALSLSVGTGLKRFRAALKRVVSAKVIICRGSPPLTNTHHRKHFFSLTFGLGTKVLEKLLMVTTLPNGNLQRPDGRIEVWVPGWLDVQEDLIAEGVSSSIATLLTTKKMPIYPRHRWIGASEAFDAFNALEGICELVSATYPVYAAELGDPIVDTRGGALPCSGAIAGSIEPLLARVGPLESDHQRRRVVA